MLIKGARKRPHPYHVTMLKHTDFVNIKDLASNMIKNRTKNTDGDVVNWLNIKWLRFEKLTPRTIKYKHRLSQGFRELAVSSERGRRKYVENLPLHFTAAL